MAVFTGAVIAALAIAKGLSSHMGAGAANRKAAEAGGIQLRQLFIQAEDDTRRRTTRGARDRGTIGVISGSSGQTGQSYVDALMSVTAETEADLRFIRFNRNASADAIRAGVRAQQQNPFLAGFSGSVGGATSGAMIGSAMK